MMEPQEIEDDEHEQVPARVAAADVAKASGMVCTGCTPVAAGSTPHLGAGGQPTTGALLALGEDLAA
jgi:hypothetical protein